MAKITDGAGTSRAAKVDDDLRLHTQSISIPEVVQATDKGLAYNINTGLITINSTGTSGLLYIKNDDVFEYVVEAIAIGNDGGATMAPRPYIEVYSNPSSGTLISGATDVEMNANRNFSNTRPFASSAYKGDGSTTLAGGTKVALLQSTTGGRDFFTINFILRPGNSIGIDYTRTVSAGSSEVYVAAIGFLREIPTGSGV